MRKYLIFVFWSHLPWAADSADLTPSPSALTSWASSAAWGHQRAAVVGLWATHDLWLCHRDLPSGSWLPTQVWVHPRLDTGGILNPNVWWELINWFSKFLVRDQQTQPRLLFATFIWQITEKFPCSCVNSWQTQQLPPWNVLVRWALLPLTLFIPPSPK